VKALKPNFGVLFFVQRSGCMRRFCSPNKGLRSIASTGSATRATKMWVECGVGMFRPNVCA
jgi:hypothetical protein